MAAELTSTSEPSTTVVAAPQWLGFTLCSCVACGRLHRRQQSKHFIVNGHGRADNDAASIMRTVLEWWAPKTADKATKSVYNGPLATRFLQQNKHGYAIMGNWEFMSLKPGDGKLTCSESTLRNKIKKLSDSGLLDVKLDVMRASDATLTSTRYVAPLVLRVAESFEGLGPEPFPMLEEEVYTRLHPSKQHPTSLDWEHAFQLYADAGAKVDFATWLKYNIPNMNERLYAVRQAMADELGVRIDVTKPFSASIAQGRWHERAFEVHIVEHVDKPAIKPYEIDSSKGLASSVIHAVRESFTPALSLEQVLKDSYWVAYETARFKKENALRLSRDDWPKLKIGRAVAYDELWLNLLGYIAGDVQENTSAYRLLPAVAKLSRYDKGALGRVIARRLDSINLDERIFFQILFGVRKEESFYTQEDARVLARDLLLSSMEEMQGRVRQADLSFQEWCQNLYAYEQQHKQLCLTSIRLSTAVLGLSRSRQSSQAGGSYSLTTRSGRENWLRSMARWTSHARKMVSIST